MFSKKWPTAGLASALLVAVPMLLAPTRADAGVGVLVAPNFTSPTAPGQVAPAQIQLGNSSTGAEAVGAVTFTDIRVTPSCGSSAPGCSAPDPNVFQLNGPFTGTASAGAVCPSSFTALVTNPSTGEIRFTPVGPAPVLDVGETCLISFTTTTLRVPTIDANPALPGRQTAVITTAVGTAANGAAGSSFGSSLPTVNPAPATISTSASPQQASQGRGFSDLANVTGATGGPTPTGTVTFQLFGPASPGFPTCSGAPFDLSAPIPLTPASPTSATAGSGTFGAPPRATAGPGGYVFVASYSGDANYIGSTTGCSDPAERVTVQALPTITVVKTATPLSRPEPGGVFTFNVVVTNTSFVALQISSLTDNVYGNIATQGTCANAVGTVLAANGGSYTCSFTGSFTGLAPASQTDTVSARAIDAAGNAAIASDDATVILTSSQPTIVVNKTASPLSRPAPGGPFTFTVVVTNTGIRAVTVTSISDNVYGNVAGRGTCSTGAILAASGGSYTCSFTGTFLGVAGATQVDVVTVAAVDSLGNQATASDDAVVTITPNRPRNGDYDGNGSTDVAVYRPSTGVWYVQSPFNAVKWGEPGDIPVPGDYNGDGRTEQAVYRPSTGVWYLLGPNPRATQWGEPGDVPVPGDYDGNGSSDVAVYRPSTGVWYVQSPFTAVKWGEPGDIPVPGDYDGNGSTEQAVYRPSTGVWYLLGPNPRATQWGEPGDIPVPADYDGNGSSDVAVYRPSTGVWYVQSPFTAVKWGEPGDIPVPGDYDGNGTTEQAVYRPSTGVWYLLGPNPRATHWGETGDIPLTLPQAVYRRFY